MELDAWVKKTGQSYFEFILCRLGMDDWSHTLVAGTPPGDANEHAMGWSLSMQTMKHIDVGLNVAADWSPPQTYEQTLLHESLHGFLSSIGIDKRLLALVESGAVSEDTGKTIGRMVDDLIDALAFSLWKYGGFSERDRVRAQRGGGRSTVAG